MREHKYFRGKMGPFYGFLSAVGNIIPHLDRKVLLQVERHCIVKSSAGRGAVGGPRRGNGRHFLVTRRLPTPILNHQPPRSTISLVAIYSPNFFGKMNVASAPMKNYWATLIHFMNGQFQQTRSMMPPGSKYFKSALQIIILFIRHAKGKKMLLMLVCRWCRFTF